MFFDTTLTESRIGRESIANLQHSLMAHAGLFAMAWKIFLAAALILALALAINNGMMNILFYHDVIPYGLPAMNEVSPFIGAGAAKTTAAIKFL